MKQRNRTGAWLVLLDDDDEPLDRVVGVFATEGEARDFLLSHDGRLEGSLETGFYAWGWSYDQGASGYTAPA